jgi:hypothetical protein
LPSSTEGSQAASPKIKKWSAGGVEGRQTPGGGRNFGDAHILGALRSIEPDIQGAAATISELVTCIFSCRPGHRPHLAAGGRLSEAPRDGRREMRPLAAVCSSYIGMQTALQQLHVSARAGISQIFPKTPGCQDFDCFSSESTLKLLMHEAHDGQRLVRSEKLWL